MNEYPQTFDSLTCSKTFIFSIWQTNKQTNKTPRNLHLVFEIFFFPCKM